MVFRIEVKIVANWADWRVKIGCFIKLDLIELVRINTFQIDLFPVRSLLVFFA